MLILSRHKDQSIFMDKGSIRIKILKVDRGKVSLGFEADRYIDIDREEIYIRKNAEIAKDSTSI